MKIRVVTAMALAGMSMYARQVEELAAGGRSMETGW